MQPNQDSLILREDENASDYFPYYEGEKHLLNNKKQDIKEDQKDLVDNRLDNGRERNRLSGQTY